MRRQLTLAILLGSLLITNHALALAESPMRTIRRTNKALNGLLRKQVSKGTPAESSLNKRLKKTVTSFIDFEELARRSLGKHWDKRTEQERDEFVKILGDLVERNYVKQLRDNLDYELEYGEQKVVGDTARVVTTVKITRKGRTEEVTVEYKMRKTPKGWMAYDVVTDDVSVVRNYRSQFNRIIRRDSYEVLVKKMRNKLEKI